MTVPPSVPKPVELSGMLNDSWVITVGVNVAFIAVQPVPVAPLMVTVSVVPLPNP